MIFVMVKIYAIFQVSVPSFEPRSGCATTARVSIYFITFSGDINAIVCLIIC